MSTVLVLEMKDIKIAIVEDDTMIRESLELFIKSKTQYTICQAVGSVEEFLDDSSNLSTPNVLILDIGLPGMSGIDGIPLIKKKYPDLD